MAAGTGMPRGTPGTPVAMGTVGSMASTSALKQGMFTTVVGTGGYGMRLRFGAGADYLTIRIVDDGETLSVLGGPEQSEGMRWWRVQDALGNVGWAAEEFLSASTMPAGWAPAAASPTFQAGQGGTPSP